MILKNLYIILNGIVRKGNRTVNEFQNRKKICFISSSGGHFEQLKMLKPLSNNYDTFWVTEKVDFASDADYYLYQTGLKDKLFLFKMFLNFLKVIRIWYKEKPDYVITTGAMIVIPMALLAKIMRKKLIFIETFAVVESGTRTGKLLYKFADLFIIQWESLLDEYPKAKYGGSLY